MPRLKSLASTVPAMADLLNRRGNPLDRFLAEPAHGRKMAPSWPAIVAGRGGLYLAPFVHLAESCRPHGGQPETRDDASHCPTPAAARRYARLAGTLSRRRRAG